MTRVRILMNPENDEHMQNFLDGEPVEYGDEIEVTAEYEKLKTFKSLISHGYIEIVEDVEETEEATTTD